MAKKIKSKRKKVAGKKSVSQKKPLSPKSARKKSVAQKSTTKTTRKAPKKVTTPQKSKPPKKAASPQKPKPRKTTSRKNPLSNPALAKIHGQLIRDRQEIFKILQASREVERHPSELNFSNEIDLAANLEGREMAFTLSSRDREELKLIEDALFKISRGTYGTCESCKKNINTKRLEIMPLTPHCIECQATMERP